MRIPSSRQVLVTAAPLLAVVHASPFPFELDVLVERALSNNPSGTYAPSNVSCPSNSSLIRTASNISSGESDFLEKRHAVTDKALTDLLNRANLTDFDVSDFMDGYSPTIAIAFSGGGYRAMLSGAGALKAFDSRTPNSTSTGQVGGLLQSATYLAGLSGGSWLVGSVVVNNFTTISALQEDENLWDFTNSILDPNGALHIVDTAEYYTELHSEVEDKENAGFDTSITDYWGRALSRQFVNATNGGPAVTWSSIALTDEYNNADMPFPIVVADGRNPGEELVSTNTTVYEFNPLEFGSFDPQLYAFTPLEYIGTNVTNGKPDNDNACIRGFDNAGFVMGTSSSLFNQFLLELGTSGLPSILENLAEDALDGLDSSDFDIADYSPNPFYKHNPESNLSANTKNLTLVDGGEDLENLPLQPLIQPVRNVDVIFAMDNSADTLAADESTTTNWPNGTAIVATYERSLMKEIANGTLFPSVPDQNTMVNLGLNNRPTFFGCNATNITANASDAPPLIVYIANTPWTFDSNKSTEDLEYSDSDRDSMILNGYNMASQGNATVRTDWPTCMACAIVQRRLERQGKSMTSQCQACFQEYCWNGTLASQKPATPYNPSLAIADKTSAAAPAAVRAMGSLIMAVGFAVVFSGWNGL